MKNLFLLVFSIFLFTSAWTQENKTIEFIGDIRYSFTSSGSDHGFEEAISGIRTRVGVNYTINSSHSFTGRLATTFSEELETPRFTIRADGSGLNLGSISFDEFYYRYKKDGLDVKLGRFQHTIAVLSNAKRSLIRFQSANVSIHWSDGIYAKKNLQNGWYGEFIGEYQPRNHTTYPYQETLDFGRNEHNITSYLALENRERDSNNIIQKGAGFFIAPNAYKKNGGYATYIAFTSRIVFDFPQPDVLHGGSVRIAGEFGQNLSSKLEDGTIAVASVGVNKFADKHDLMVELASTDAQWLLANAYAQGGEEIEVRYKYFISNTLAFDTRYRIRHFGDGTPNNHGAFFRLTYSF